MVFADIFLYIFCRTHKPKYFSIFMLPINYIPEIEISIQYLVGKFIPCKHLHTLHVTNFNSYGLLKRILWLFRQLLKFDSCIIFETNYK